MVAWEPSEAEGVSASTARAFLNGKINSVAGGTNQMQRNAISEQVLGLPREPSYDRDKPFDQVLRDAEHLGRARRQPAREHSQLTVIAPASYCPALESEWTPQHVGARHS